MFSMPMPMATFAVPSSPLAIRLPRSTVPLLVWREKGSNDVARTRLVPISSGNPIPMPFSSSTFFMMRLLLEEARKIVYHMFSDIAEKSSASCGMSESITASATPPAVTSTDTTSSSVSARPNICELNLYVSPPDPPASTWSPGVIERGLSPTMRVSAPLVRNAVGFEEL